MSEKAEDAQSLRAFHVEEFKFLKTELIEDTKAAAFNFRFALTISGAIAAWVVEYQPINLVAAFLPLVISSLMFGLNWGIQARSASRGKYLERIEPYLAWPGFGYENTGKPPVPKDPLGWIVTKWSRLLSRQSHIAASEEAETGKRTTMIDPLRLGIAETICWAALLALALVFFMVCCLVVVIH